MWRKLTAVATGAAVALAGVVTGVGAPQAEAVNAAYAGFDAGMIISDKLFFDGNAMTASQVQTFLNQKVPVCKDDNLTNDITCLKDYRADTYAISGNANCKAISAQTSRTAAQIIDTVARACGVSQKALLVTLQKEQGLVTHTDPGARMYEIAMGYACPDSEPCDPTKGGFFRQVYLGAWQFKQYAAKPSSYAYRAGQWNVIKHSPDSSCGTKDVYIENQATAGLYNYTPYTPNKAALDANPGVNVTCGSYGNRNFYYFFTQWFGSTDGPVVDNSFLARWQELGGIAGPGPATASSVKLASDGGGIYQEFTNGTLYKRNGGEIVYRAKSWAISQAYVAAGGPAGAWGWPVTASGSFGGVPLAEFTNVRVAMIDGAAVVGYPFSDVSDNRGSNDYTALAPHVWWMWQEGHANGWAGPLGPEFRPVARTNRDVMAAFLYRMYGDPAFEAPATPTFVDVPATHVFYKEIEWLATTGIAQGWTTDKGVEFRPTWSIARDQAAAFLYRLAEVEGYVPPTSSGFVDVSLETTPFYTEVSWLAEQGITTGWTTSAGVEFRPSASVTREQMAAFLARFDALVSAG